MYYFQKINIQFNESTDSRWRQLRSWFELSFVEIPVYSCFKSAGL